jgi:hypothetical protein
MVISIGDSNVKDIRQTAISKYKQVDQQSNPEHLCLFLYYQLKMEPKTEVASLLTDISSVRMELYFGCRRLADLDLVTVTDSFLWVYLSDSETPPIKIH